MLHQLSFDNQKDILAEELSHVSKPLLSNAKPDTHAVTRLIENEKLYAGKGTSANKPFGLGSTGRNIPASLNEKLALEQAISNPNSRRLLPVPMTDKRWPASDGWVKMSQNINEIEVHYVRNTKTGAIDDFKFK
ncbi:hypothetical protein [Photorhabdus viridis]|uniref:hypothetical protein n=1 Tax=Photorhabdus viridis TaxID=3163327 RepID=UPI0033070E31